MIYYDVDCLNLMIDSSNVILCNHFRLFAHDVRVRYILLRTDSKH